MARYQRYTDIRTQNAVFLAAIGRCAPVSLQHLSKAGLNRRTSSVATAPHPHRRHCDRIGGCVRAPTFPSCGFALAHLHELAGRQELSSRRVYGLMTCAGSLEVDYAVDEVETGQRVPGRISKRVAGDFRQGQAACLIWAMVRRSTDGTPTSPCELHLAARHRQRSASPAPAPTLPRSHQRAAPPRPRSMS